MARATTSSTWHVERSPDQKVLLLLRHAKSDWDTGEADHERPLNQRGRGDAAAVGALLVSQGLAPDVVVCSTAVRTRETWDRAVGAGAQATEVRYREEIYLARAETLVELVRDLPEAAQAVLLVGHSPGVPDLVQFLGDRNTGMSAWGEIDQKYPTAGLAVLTLPGPWREAGQGRAALVAFEAPRGTKH